MKVLAAADIHIDPPENLARLRGPSRVGDRGFVLVLAGLVRTILAHSGDLVVHATSAGRAVGVDAERIRDPADPRSLVASAFAPEEARSLAPLEPTARACRVLARRTLEEACVDARGTGPSPSRASFWLALATSGAIRFSTREPGQDATAWRFRRADPGRERPLAPRAAGAALPGFRTRSATPLVETKAITRAARRRS